MYIKGVEMETFCGLPSDNGGFISVSDENKAIFYGGTQDWFGTKEYRDFGCGTIAAENVALYFRGGNNEIGISEYMTFAEEINRFMPPDADGLRLMLVCRRKLGIGMKYFPAGFICQKRLFKIIAGSICRDIPVIISVYENPRGEEFTLERNGKCCTVKKHFMTITGLETDGKKQFMVISSWGKRYAMDFEKFCKLSSCGFINRFGSAIFVPIKKSHKAK